MLAYYVISYNDCSRFDPAHLPPGFRPYGAAEVAGLRRRPLTDAHETRDRLLAGTHAGP